MFDVVILASGASSRFSAKVNKMLVSLKARPLFLISIDKFLKIKDCENIVLVISEEIEENVKSILSGLGLLEKVKVVFGGKNRQDSAYIGLQEVKNEIVLFHDAARPLTLSSDINRVFEEVKKHRASFLASKSTSTIKMVDNKVVTIDREHIFFAETPQGGYTEDFLKAHKIAMKKKFDGTDDMILLEKFLKINPSPVLSRNKNIKITTIEDYQYARYLVGDK